MQDVLVLILFVLKTYLLQSDPGCCAAFNVGTILTVPYKHKENIWKGSSETQLQGNSLICGVLSFGKLSFSPFVGGPGFGAKLNAGYCYLLTVGCSRMKAQESGHSSSLPCCQSI